jgi:hypothetical protein
LNANTIPVLNAKTAWILDANTVPILNAITIWILDEKTIPILDANNLGVKNSNTHHSNRHIFLNILILHMPML